MSRKVKFKPSEHIQKCPKCGNNTEFTINSNQFSEDCCEIWASCKCGYDPTRENTGYRVEDVWGGCDDNNCIDAVNISWNDAINSLKPQQP